MSQKELLRIYNTDYFNTSNASSGNQVPAFLFKCQTGLDALKRTNFKDLTMVAMQVSQTIYTSLYSTPLLVAILVVTTLSGQWLQSIGCLYPIYRVIQLQLQHQHNADEVGDQSTQQVQQLQNKIHQLHKQQAELRYWIQYFSVYSVLCVFQPGLDSVLTWIPLYGLGKLIFIMACMIPSFMLVQNVYEALFPILYLQMNQIVHTIVELHPLSSTRRIKPEMQGTMTALQELVSAKAK